MDSSLDAEMVFCSVAIFLNEDAAQSYHRLGPYAPPDVKSAWAVAEILEREVAAEKPLGATPQNDNAHDAAPAAVHSPDFRSIVWFGEHYWRSSRHRVETVISKEKSEEKQLESRNGKPNKT